MFNLKSLEIENLFAHKQSKYSFESNKVVVIYGENLDRGEEGASNGAGKSSIAECINLAIKGEPIRNIRNIEVICNGEAKGCVTVVMENKITSTEVMIEREFYNNSKPQKCIISVNGEPYTQLTDIDSKNAFIFDILGITPEDFSNYFLISKNNYTSFLDASDTQRKAFINRFSKADRIDSIFENIEVDVASIQDKIIVVDTKLSVNDAKIGTYRELMGDEDTWKSGIASKIELIQNSIELKDLEIINNQDKYLKYKKELEELIIKEKENNTGDLKQEHIQDHIDSIKTINERISKINKELNELDKVFEIDIKTDISNRDSAIQTELDQLRDCKIETTERIHECKHVLAGVISCPSCSHEFTLDKENISLDTLKTDLEEYEEMLKDIEGHIKSLNIKREELKGELLQYNKRKQARKVTLTSTIYEWETERSLIESMKKMCEDAFENVQKVARRIESSRAEIKHNQSLNLEKTTRIEESIKEMHSEIEQLGLMRFEDVSEEWSGKISILEKESERLQKTKSELFEEKLSVESWIFTFKRFKSFLANQSVLIIGDYINFFLGKMNSNLQVEIDGFKVLANKKTKENINIQVTRDGVIEGGLNKFSSGEKVLIELATILALQKLINVNSESNSLNLLFLDEIVESLDAQNINFVLKALSQLNQTILVVTHGIVDSNMMNKLVVRKQNGISQII